MLIKLTLPFNSQIFTIFEKIEVWLFLKFAIILLAFSKVDKHNAE